MSMTIGDANDLQLLLRHVLRGGPGQDVGRVPADDAARDAAARLADRSRQVLSAGQGGDAVLAAWPDPATSRSEDGQHLLLVDQDGDLWELDAETNRWVFNDESHDESHDRDQLERLYGPVREVRIRC